ncbi:transposase-like protein [Nitrobacter winogradskyi]|uniref:Transposase-like protein n=1 Tax=Nitrobacter winogradskyi TaxID=913 RepID=A0ACC6AF23_NITWI|nr:transposase-like protein [Nitrobacter winogradskyi]
MPRHRSHSVEFKRQVAQEFLSGETLHGLAKRHDLSRNLIRIWVESTRPARWTTTRALQIWSRNTKRGSPRSSGWSAVRRSSWSF